MAQHSPTSANASSGPRPTAGSPGTPVKGTPEREAPNGPERGSTGLSFPFPFPPNHPDPSASKPGT